MKICFLINQQIPLAKTENRLYLANAALKLKHAASFGFVDSLSCHHGELRALLAPIKTSLSAGDSFDAATFAEGDLSKFDLVWILGFGLRETFLDKLQLLRLLPPSVRIINSLDALIFLHSKISQHDLGGIIQYPETHISSDFQSLWRIFQTGGDWIVKPAGESLGRNVFKLKAGDSNARAILQIMTDNHYCLLQRYVPEVANGEKRVLLAGGQVIGQYSKKATIDHRGNLHQEAEAHLSELLPQEREACEHIGKYLLAKGVYFAGLDLAWPYLIEWNVLNPGGLGTIDRLGGGNLAETAIGHVLASSQTVQTVL